jgi:hypothetical protein
MGQFSPFLYNALQQPKRARRARFAPGLLEMPKSARPGAQTRPLTTLIRVPLKFRTSWKLWTSFSEGLAIIETRPSKKKKKRKKKKKNWGV